MYIRNVRYVNDYDCNNVSFRARGYSVYDEITCLFNMIGDLKNYIVKSIAAFVALIINIIPNFTLTSL